MHIRTSYLGIDLGSSTTQIYLRHKGIVISELAEKHGIAFLYGGNIVTWFSLILYNEG